MKLKRTESGLVIPAIPETPSEPEKPLGPLELQELEGRDEVHEAFSTILNCPGLRGGALCQANRLKTHAREDLVYAVARQLLGADWDCERLC